MANGQCKLTDGSKANDWRLPSDIELQRLIDDGYRYESLMAAGFVSFTDNFYWSYSEYVSDSKSALCEQMSTEGLLYNRAGARLIDLKTDGGFCRVWPVRPGTGKPTPTGYVSQGGLIWMPISFYDTWTNANAYCAGTTINGQTGWRLPTKDELVSLYKSGLMDGLGWELGTTWSSTPGVSGGHYTVGLFLNSGGYISLNIDTNTATYYDHVSCVR